jgi:hypothetical protein
MTALDPHLHFADPSETLLEGSGLSPPPSRYLPVLPNIRVALLNPRPIMGRGSPYQNLKAPFRFGTACCEVQLCPLLMQHMLKRVVDRLGPENGYLTRRLDFIAQLPLS